MSRDVKDPKFRQWVGDLPIRQYAVLFYDEVYQMVQHDPPMVMNPRTVEQAQALREVIMGWPAPIRTNIYQWLRSYQ